MRGLTLLSFFTFAISSAYGWSHSDVTSLAEEAIANTNASAANYQAHPSDPRFRDAYLRSLENLALARQAIEEEFLKGAINARTRTRVLVRLARLLNQEPNGDLGSAVEVALEENPDGERFVPPPIPDAAEEKSPANEAASTSFPSPIASTGNTVVFLTRDLFPSSAESPVASESRPARAKEKKLPLSKGYNAPSLPTVRPLGSVLDATPVEDSAEGSLKDLLATALEKARQTPVPKSSGVVTAALTKPLAPTLAPGLKSLAAGLSGQASRSSASLGGIEPELLSLAVPVSRARNKLSWWWLLLAFPPIFAWAFLRKRSKAAPTVPT
ncbi:MAG: hypothetical protein R3B54_14380 [Bdellovibrionota bacterium]